jgi:hypothetical protein
MSRRRETETAYRAESPGKSARHDEAPDSGGTVNAAIVSRKFTFLSREIRLTGIRRVSLQFESLNEAQGERPGQTTEPYRATEERLGHKGIKTTMIYTHVLNRGPAGVRSPIDGP